MNRKIKVALAGLGSRGKDTYAKAADCIIGNLYHQVCMERFHVAFDRKYIYG